MYSYCSIFIYLLKITLIALAATFVSVIALVAETYRFPASSLREKTFEQVVMWLQFVILQQFVKPQTKVYVVYMY